MILQILPITSKIHLYEMFLKLSVGVFNNNIIMIEWRGCTNYIRITMEPIATKKRQLLTIYLNEIIPTVIKTITKNGSRKN